MNQTFLLLQLAFNALMLIGLVTLAFRDRNRTVKAKARRRAVEAAQSQPQPSPVLRNPGLLALQDLPASAAHAGPLDDLVAAAERKELAAEATLKARMDRFRERAAH